MATTTWIVAADSSRARVLQAGNRSEHLTQIEDMVNPEARMNDRELTTDAHPRLRGGGSGSDREETSASEHATDLFVKRIAEHLDKARMAHRYDRLHLVAPPKFLGKLRKAIGPEVEKLVTEEIPKDLSWLNTHELDKRLNDG